ncbi:Peptide transporter PTR2 [Yarrowia sp. B02]|nr:Peptide transporter PTR2 [Yarrowia sp. B02]
MTKDDDLGPIAYSSQAEYNSQVEYRLESPPDFPEDEDLKDTLAKTTSVREESVHEGSVDQDDEEEKQNYEFAEIYEDHEHYSHDWINYTDEWNPNGLRIAGEEDIGLRRVSGPVLKITYVLALVEFAERGSYYGLTTVISNFVQFPLPKGGNGWGATPKNSQATAGALDQGLQVATALTLVLNFLSYLTPLLGAYLADARYGRYPTIWAGTIICGIGHVIIVIAGVPGVIEAQKAALGLFIAGLIIFAFGTGLFKPNLLPLVLEQYREDDNWVKTLPSGEQVVVDKETTLQRMTLVYYWAVNVGGFLGLGTAYAEKRIEYWLAFLVPTILYFFLPALLYIIRNKVYKVPSSKNSIIAGFCGVIWQYVFRKKSTYPPMIGAILQWQIYETSPCGYYATNCEAGVAPITI